MKSNICRIDKGKADLVAILKESEKVAVYNDLTPKQTMQLRLICEEMDGMLPHILGKFNGDFWIEFNDGVCKINASIIISDLNSGRKNDIIAISTDGKNASATGIVGSIRNAIENFFLNEEAYMSSFATSSHSLHSSTQYSEYTGYSYTWSLEDYKGSVKKKEQPEAWDELEKSVISSVADNVIVGVKGDQANIIIIKKFA